MKRSNGFVVTLELPSGKKLQLLIIFDTTGSMYSCLLRVRRYIDDLCGKLFGKLGNVQIAIMAVGDYCDARSTYVTVGTKLTTNAKTISTFVNNVSATHGGDLAEAYELALHEGLKLDWDSNPNTIKLAVLIADDVPHRIGEMNSGRRVEHDWEEVIDRYVDRGIKIAAVQCLGNSYARGFYRSLAQVTSGYYLQLGQFGELEDLILGLCYASESPEKFQEFTRVVEARRPISRSEFDNFREIGRGRTGFSARVADRFTAREDGLLPVPPGRFQILPVTKTERVTDFIKNNGLVFVRGGVFYELTMSEIIQTKKKVVIMDRITGDMFTGDAARRLIGSEPGTHQRINPKNLSPEFRARYRAFVQSTSYTRDMDPGTEALFNPNYNEATW